jgi:hypothetical protein
MGSKTGLTPTKPGQAPLPAYFYNDFASLWEPVPVLLSVLRRDDALPFIQSAKDKVVSDFAP